VALAYNGRRIGTDAAATTRRGWKAPRRLGVRRPTRAIAGTPGLGGSVLVGAALAFGTFNRNATDLRPFVGFDLTMGLLEDSAIKLRYASVLGDFQPRRGEFVSYHGVYVVGTTRW
jgi:hypothetical protein